MENQKIFLACETAGCSNSPTTGAVENDELSPSTIININNNNNSKIMKRKSAASPILNCTASSANVVLSPSKFCSVVVSKKVKNDDHQCRTTDVAENLEPKIDSWLKEAQMFSNNEKNLALTLLIKKFCNTSQRRLIRTIVEPFFQKDFSNPEVVPKEMVMKILSYLSCKDLLNVSSTCRSLRQSAEDWSLWKEKCPDWLDWLKVDNFPANQYHHSSCVLTPTTPYAPLQQQQLPKLSERCPPKAAYLRRQRINANWRLARPRRQIVLRGHDDHVITCLQICNDDIIVSGSDDNTLKVWSVTNGQCLHTLVGHTGGVWCSQVTSDGQLIISGSTDRTARVWETATGQCLFTLLGHTSTVRCMALKGDILITGSRDSTLRAWNVRTGQCLHVFSGHVAAVRCVQFDGKRAVSGAYDFVIRVWDVERRTCVHTLVGHTNRVYSLQFDSVRNIVVSGSLDTTIRVWNVNTGVCLSTLTGHQSLTSGMQLNGQILVSGNADSTLKIWDIETGRCLHTLNGSCKHTSAVTSLQVLPAYNLISTSSDDGTVKLWDSSSGRFLTDLTKLQSGGSGGCIWRLRATPTLLVCAVGSRNGTEDTKLLIYDFEADCP